jgi:hypothetical protein
VVRKRHEESDRRAARAQEQQQSRGDEEENEKGALETTGVPVDRSKESAGAKQQHGHHKKGPQTGKAATEKGRMMEQMNSNQGW